MKLSYRNQRNAEAVAAYWKKPLDRPDWYKIEAQAGDEAEILIFDPIGWPWTDAGEFVRALAEMKQKTITIRINSPGGDVFDANAIHNAIISHPSKIITRNDALAASAASFIAIAGKERQAYKNSMLMIHEPWVFAIGNQYELREIADVLEKLSDTMVETYTDGSNVGKREIARMMKDETWMKATEAKEKGFLDTILDGKAAKAEFDLSMFAHAPADAPCGRGAALPQGPTPTGPEADPLGRRPTARDAERILRDAGYSRSEAKTLLAGRQQDPGQDHPAGRRAEPATEDVTEIAALIKQTTALYERR